MGPEVASAISIGGLALDAGSKIVGAEGQAAGQEYEAQKAERAAEMGRIKATQSDAQSLEQLNTTLGHISAIRVAANTDPTSPTGLAITAEEQRVANREMTIRRTSLDMQSEQDLTDAAFRRSSANTALLGGYLGAASSLGKGFATASGFGGGSSGYYGGSPETNPRLRPI
jgi:hypothetical protein